MTTTLTVTPGTSANAATRVTAAFLNALGTPTVTIADGSLPAAAFDADDFISTFGDAFRGVNWLTWGTLYYDAFAGATVACPAGLRTENARGWFVLPAGAAVDAGRSPRTSSNAALEAGKVALQVKGAGGLTSVRVGTYLPPALTAQLYGGNLTFSLYVWNNTGAAITPSLEVSSSGSAGDEGTVSLRATVAGTSCANSAWTRQSFALDATAITNWANGARLALVFTVAGGQLDNTTDYVLLADGQIDKDATVASAHIAVPPQLPEVPAGTILPWTGLSTAVPAGWLFCDGTAVSRTVYARLLGVTGTAYGPGDGSTTFNLPDLRGRTWVGAEIAGFSQGRLELTLSGTTTTSSAVVTFADTSTLRPGMGCVGTGIPDGTTLVSLTPTAATLSAAATANGTVSLRFSKLGAGDAEVVGTSGNGASAGVRSVGLQKYGCTASASINLTVGDVSELAVGMVVSGPGISGAPTIVAFRSATVVDLSSVQTVTNATLAFTMPAPEGDAERLLMLARANPVVANCSWSNDSNMTEGSGTADLTIPATLTGLLRVGMKVTGTGIPADTYLTEISSSTAVKCTSKTVAAAITTSSGVTLTFTGAVESRATAQAAGGLAATAGGWIVKT